ncbi:hypothetical protein B0H15DRAFT_766306, partial [Mycena belliarum]
VASLFLPAYSSSFASQQRHAHENPVLFYSCVIGGIGPVMLLVVPPIRARLGYKPAEPIPLSYPVPNRRRRQVHGYEDE